MQCQQVLFQKVETVSGRSKESRSQIVQRRPPVDFQPAILDIYSMVIGGR